MRAIPLTYAELKAGIEGGVYPHERSWIDFKRRLYPEDGDAGARDKVSQEPMPLSLFSPGFRPGVSLG